MRENNGHEPRAINPLQGAAGQATCGPGASASREPPLDRDVSVDVCIVGRRHLGPERRLSSSRRAARPSSVLDDGADRERNDVAHDRASLVRARRPLLRDRAHARPRGDAARRQSHAAAIDAIERTVTEAGLDCDFVRLAGLPVPRPRAESSKTLDRDLEAAQRAGSCGRTRGPRAARRVRHRAVQPLRAPGHVPSSQVPGRARRRDRTARRHGLSRDDARGGLDRDGESRGGATSRRRRRHGGLGGLRDQRPDQRPRRRSTPSRRLT